MKENTNMFFERDSVLKNTEEAKKDQKRKLKLTFFEKRKEKILPERTRLCVCQNVRIEGKHFQKRMVKHFRKCFKDMVGCGE